MTYKERYEELIRTIKNLTEEMVEERKHDWGKTYTVTEIIELLDSLAEFQE